MGPHSVRHSQGRTYLGEFTRVHVVGRGGGETWLTAENGSSLSQSRSYVGEFFLVRVVGRGGGDT